MLPIAAIQEKLAFLYERTPDKTVYGSTKTERDWYALNPVMPEPALQAFEARLGVRLPESVREFVLKVGNGGAGPFRGLGDHCFLWGIGHVDLHTPFDWDDFIRVKKYTEAEFKQKKKGEMERILRFYGRYIPVERPNRYQKEVKAFYHIDLEENEYIQYGPLRGCLPIFQNWHKMVYLIIAGEPDYVGRVLLGPSLDGESVGGLYELRGFFSAFYTEWLEGEVRALKG